MRRHDYLPFGEELTSAHGAQRSGVGYEPPASNVRQKFTGKERDGETGLDYFLARYYSSIQGRFTSPDEFSGGPEELYNFADTASDNPTFYADLHDPQSLNKYQYCYNDPLNNIDPDGHSVWTKIAKFVYKAARKGDVVAAGKDVAEDAITVVSPGKSIGERVFAAVSLASEISPVSISDGRDAIRWISPLFKRLDKSGNLLETKGIDGLGSLLNASKCDKFIQSKGRAVQFGNDGSASLAKERWNRIRYSD